MRATADIPETRAPQSPRPGFHAEKSALVKAAPNMAATRSQSSPGVAMYQRAQVATADCAGAGGTRVVADGRGTQSPAAVQYQ